MLKLKNGNILESDANIICHQVNCQGVMGAGLALQIRKRYPSAFEEYRGTCTKSRRESARPYGNDSALPCRPKEAYCPLLWAVWLRPVWMSHGL